MSELGLKKELYLINRILALPSMAPMSMTYIVRTNNYIYIGMIIIMIYSV